MAKFRCGGSVEAIQLSCKDAGQRGREFGKVAEQLLERVCVELLLN